ncbi:DUF6313 family protein [Nonomuraea sp. LP-02]|uniref:DUF6313 family protein n=1 Tax=Nonomuraea sp. LP-02 TaxID=3097960 RepID=UPI002E37C483|nr:DUF6313 family protein [Nonomuraea sp. LP-02]MED7923952.1 DUF6313 family protein [Nonomuraea sp. LP-02]
MAQSAPSGFGVPPPPRERLLHRLRRWRLSLSAHHGVRYWTWTRGLPILLAFGALFVANGLLIGWREAYEVTLAITSPADTAIPVLAWFLSVAGWLLAPAAVGAIAGFMVSNAITSRRTRSIEELLGQGERSRDREGGSA